MWRSKNVNLLPPCLMITTFRSCSILSTTTRGTYHDSKCGYFILFTLRWHIHVDPVLPDRWSWYASILLLLKEYFNSWVDCFQDSWSSVDSLPKQHNANDLKAQSVEEINSSSCPLYHEKEVFFCLFPSFVLRFKSLQKIKHWQISVFTGTPFHTIQSFCFVFLSYLHILY